MRLATATIDLEAIAQNLAQVRARARQSKVLAVVKADGYGHGLERVASALGRADGFGVASIDDAMRLRQAGVAKPVVLLSGFDTDRDLQNMSALNISSVLHHDEQLARLRSVKLANPVRIWLKLNTGMNRLGFAAERASELLAALTTLPTVNSDVVLMTHLASADLPQSSLTVKQIERFHRTTVGLPGARSIANSAAVIDWPAAHADWVRPGGILYGLSTFSGKSGADLGFIAAMQFTTKIIAVNDVQAGASIGYAESFIAARAMRVGAIAVGYGDGYPRNVADDSYVLIGGQKAAIVGRVSMDLMTVDLSQIPHAKIGDEVILWGRDLPIERVADNARTLSYELSCGLTKRVRFLA
jgi:alanine racemase